MCPLSPSFFSTNRVGAYYLSVVSRAILKAVYRFGIPNSDPQTLKSVDFWRKFSSPFVFAEPREQCFELFRMQNSRNFPRLRPWTPLGCNAPRLPNCTTVFLSSLVEKLSPQKYCWIRHWIYIFLKTTMWYGLDFMFNVFRLMVWKLIIVSKNTQQWSLLPFFFFCYSPMLIIKVEKSLEGKAKI